jgi:hypothetical protein
MRDAAARLCDGPLGRHDVKARMRAKGEQSFDTQFLEQAKAVRTAARDQ